MEDPFKEMYGWFRRQRMFAKVYLVVSLVLSLITNFNIISPATLADQGRALQNFEVWRPFTSMVFQGNIMDIHLPTMASYSFQHIKNAVVFIIAEMLGYIASMRFLIFPICMHLSYLTMSNCEQHTSREYPRMQLIKISLYFFIYIHVSSMLDSILADNFGVRSQTNVIVYILQYLIRILLMHRQPFYTRTLVVGVSLLWYLRFPSAETNMFLIKSNSKLLFYGALITFMFLDLSVRNYMKICLAAYLYYVCSEVGVSNFLRAKYEQVKCLIGMEQDNE